MHIDRGWRNLLLRDSSTNVDMDVSKSTSIKLQEGEGCYTIFAGPEIAIKIWNVKQVILKQLSRNDCWRA